ncbi:MAG: hypothetical protein LUH22_14720 [Bacteroides sp.]|nr:hypothetical protein [Bacteroides sp.]
MKKKIYLLILTLVSMSLLPAFSQKNEYEQQFAKFETPTVASFTKFIDHPVNLFNGTPDVNIPIYTLKDGMVEIPITLRYNTSGIKVAEEASWVGLGWNLNVGGVIVQNSVGRQDNSRYFTENLNYYPSGIFQNYTTIPYNVNDKSTYDSFFSFAKEGNLEPDAFYFSYPGNSGKFFIDYRDNTIHQIKKDKSIKIENQKNTDTWKITTETGIIHTFGQVKRSHPLGKSDPVSATYYLIHTLYPNGQFIEYSYTASTIFNFNRNDHQPLALNKPVGGISGPKQIFPEEILSIVKGTELTLATITTKNYQIEFITSSRSDLQNGLKLDEVKVSALKSEWGVAPKRFKFNYDYFTTSTLGQYWVSGGTIDGFTFDPERLKKRLKLLSVHEVIGTSTLHNKYSFDYNTRQLPIKTSFAVDYWGYFNGQLSNTSYLPDFSILLNSSEFGRRLSSLQGWKANRAYHFQSCEAGMLKKITYPTGGYSVYTYSANEFKYTHFIPTINDLSPKVVTIIDRNNDGSDRRSYSFQLTNTTEYKFNWSLERGLNSWSAMSGSKYTITESGRIIKSEQVAPSSSSLSRLNGEFVLNLSPGNYTVTVDIPDRLGDQYGSMLNHGQLSMTISGLQTRSYSEGAGLRVSKIDFFESPTLNSPTYSVAYEYPNPGINAVLYSPPYFYRIYNVRYTILKGSSNVIEECQGEEADISGTSYCSAPYSTTGIVGYSMVRERIVSGDGNAGTKVYSFFNSGEVSGASMNIQIPNPRNGTLVSTKYYDNTGNEVKSESFDYSFNKIHHYWGVNLIDNYNRTPSFYITGDQRPVDWNIAAPLLDFGDYYGRFSTMLYALGSFELLMTSKTIVQDNVKTIENYQYNSHGLLKESSMVHSDGKTHATRITYPSDYNCGVYATMVSKNMLVFPVEKRTIVNNNLVKGDLTQYKTNGSDIVVGSISSVVAPSSGNPTGFTCSGAVTSIYPQQNVQIQKYDGQSNPIYISQNGTEHIVYLWGYNYQYPIAAIQNATYEEVKTALNNVAPESLSAATIPNMSTINGLSNKLPNALITTYTYKPLYGITSMTTPDKKTTYYQYDSYGRLQEIYIENEGVKEILEYYEYNYANQKN